MSQPDNLDMEFTIKIAQLFSKNGKEQMEIHSCRLAIDLKQLKDFFKVDNRNDAQ